MMWRLRERRRNASGQLGRAGTQVGSNSSGPGM